MHIFPQIYGTHSTHGIKACTTHIYIQQKISSDVPLDATNTNLGRHPVKWGVHTGVGIDVPFWGF